MTMRTDRRDERLAEILESALGDLHPVPEPEGAIRRGTKRRITRSLASLATVAVFVGATIWAATVVRSDDLELPGATVTFASTEASWTFEHPSGWSVRTERSAGPERIVNMLRTTITNRPLPQDTRTFGPNSGGNSEFTSALGDTAVVVLVERFWSHATPLSGEPRGPGGFAEDAQSPGWTFRERARCEGTLCFHVIEWVGPDASADDRDRAAAIAQSVRLSDTERWTETDGERTTLHDEVDRFTVTYPSDWIVADEAVNTWLSSPAEILALATYPLRPGGEAVNDAQVPSEAIEDLGPNDVFIWLLDASDDEGFPPRPGGFEPSEPCQGDNWDELCPEPEGRGPLDIPGIRSWWLGFHDAGRGFYVFVGMGEQVYADPARAAQAWDVLDSLRFLPR
jgi:hypothetical protein